MGAAEDLDQQHISKMDPESAERFARLEGLIVQVLKELRGRKTKGVKRARTVAAQASERAEQRYKPTELQMQAAKRALMRR